MRKIILALLLIVSIGNVYAQSDVNRAGAANKVIDARLGARYNFNPPVYADTTAANVQKGTDSCYALIATRDVNGYWMRECNPKRWVRLLPSTSSSITNITIINQVDSSVNIEICVGIDNCDTITVNQVTIEDAQTVELINDTTIVICNENACDTATINQQQFAYFFQNALTQISPGIAELGGDLLHNTDVSVGGESLLSLYMNKDIGFPNYPNTRIDPPIISVFGPDASGTLQAVPYVNQTRYGIVSGGIVTWVEDYDYHVSPAIYYINGVAYTSPDTTVTLAAADPTNDRIDAFVVNEDGEVEVITGTPSADPQQPSVDPETQILLTFALVTASTTAPPGIVSECAYQENAEWTAVASAPLRIDVNSTNNPCAGSKTIEGTQVLVLDNVTLTRSVAFDPRTSHQVLTFQIRSKAAWSSRRRLSFSWRLSGVTVGAVVNLSEGAFGFNSANTTDCQTIAIPLSLFGLPTTTSVNQLYFQSTSSGGNLNQQGAQGFYIDEICLQGGGGLTPPTPPTGITSIGSLPPLFNATTTAGATTFAQIAQGQNEVFIGPASGADANPTFRVLVPADIPTDLGYYKNMEQLTDTSIALIRGDNTRDTIAVSPGSVYAANGLTMRNDSTVVLGGTLDENTTVNTGGFLTTWSGSNPSNTVLSVINSSATSPTAITGTANSGTGVSGSTSSGTGVLGTSVAGNAVSGSASSGVAIVGASTSGRAFNLSINPSSTNSVASLGIFRRRTSGTAANGLGGSIDISLEDASGAEQTSNELISKWTDATQVTRTSQLIITGVNSGTTVDKIYIGGAATQINATRFETYKGTTTAAANDLTLPNDGNLFTISGNTQINAITTTDWQAGSEVAFIFTGTPTLKNNTAGGAGTATMLLAGRVDFVAAAGDYIGLRYDGTNWYETNRKLAATGGTYTFSNGLTESPAGTVKFGGTLTGNTTVTIAGFTTTWTGTYNTSSPAMFQVLNAGTGTSIGVTSAGSNATVSVANSSSGNGLLTTAASGNAIRATSTTGLSGSFRVNPASTNTVATVAEFIRGTTGTAANNIGGALALSLESSTGDDRQVGTITYLLTDATDATRTSSVKVTGILSASAVDIFTMNANGSVQLRPITAAAASAITAADGMIIYASDTDATFTSVGLWARENGVWVKL